MSEEKKNNERYEQEILHFLELKNEARDLINEIVDNINTDNPSESDYRMMRGLLGDSLPISRMLFITQCVQDRLIRKSFPNIVHQLYIKEHINKILEGMDYAEAGMDVRLLIEQGINSWIRLLWNEDQLTENQKSLDRSEFEFWDKRLTAAHHRFLRAFESLAKYKKLTS